MALDSTSTVDPFVSFMDAQQAQERAEYNARVEARYAKPPLQQIVDTIGAELADHDRQTHERLAALARSPIPTVVEFKPEQVPVKR